MNRKVVIMIRKVQEKIRKGHIEQQIVRQLTKIQIFDFSVQHFVVMICDHAAKSIFGHFQFHLRSPSYNASSHSSLFHLQCNLHIFIITLTILQYNLYLTSEHSNPSNICPRSLLTRQLYQISIITCNLAKTKMLSVALLVKYFHQHNALKENCVECC